jgi:hypothetical protein
MSPIDPAWSTARQLVSRATEWFDHKVGWHRLPTPLGLLVLVGVRDTLRQQNLFDTETVPDPTPPPAEAGVTTHRNVDGTYNDLDHPMMGAAGRRFGRNVNPAHAQPETNTLLTPNPRLVSRRLMTRDTFQPATSLNLLAATWIQFMVKDWISHGPGDATQPHTVDLADDDPWPVEGRPMVIPSLTPDPTSAKGLTAFLNENTPWWDASSIYGDTAQQQQRIRGPRGTLDLDAMGLLTTPVDNASDPARVPGFWAGLATMGVIFALEHNAVCAALADAYPKWDDDEIYERARLVISALIAKIHTVQWTPALLAHPTTVAALRANWYGLAGQRIKDTFGRVSRNEVISGIAGAHTDHFGVPYTLTEEFTIVYRMHPLIPDDYQIRSWRTDHTQADHTLADLTGPAGRDLLASLDMADVLYSFGTAHPGAIVLHNFPRFLQQFTRPDGHITDLAATDILRTRELGVPRYNEFRRHLHLTPARDFADLTDDPDTQATLRDLYTDIEQVDTIVGMFAEKRPDGFAFSDTAFRIFVLMASRRLNSDRFFTDYFTPEVYSPIGYRWVVENDFTSVLLRHYPQLRSSLAGVANPFAPWQAATTG